MPWHLKEPQIELGFVSCLYKGLLHNGHSIALFSFHRPKVWLSFILSQRASMPLWILSSDNRLHQEKVVNLLYFYVITFFFCFLVDLYGTLHIPVVEFGSTVVYLYVGQWADDSFKSDDNFYTHKASNTTFVYKKLIYFSKLLLL